MGRKEELFNGYTVSDLQDEKVLEVCFASVNIFNTTELHLKMVKMVHLFFS